MSGPNAGSADATRRPRRRRPARPRRGPARRTPARCRPGRDTSCTSPVSTSRCDRGMVCSTTNPPSSSEAMCSRCSAPCRAAATKSARSSTCPAMASAEATPAVPWEKLGLLDRYPGHIRQSTPASVGSATRQERLAAGRHDVGGGRAGGPRGGEHHSGAAGDDVRRRTMRLRLRARRRFPAGGRAQLGQPPHRPRSRPGASSRSAVTSPARPSYNDASTRSALEGPVSRSTMPVASAVSASVHRRWRLSSARTGASPAMPA